jgi:uncharacterized protein (TIGR00251 family)
VSAPPFLRAHGDVVYLHVKAQPRAPRNEIGEALGNELKIRIAAPPVDSAANETLVEFLADVLDCSRSCIQIARGHASRHKVIAIRGIPLSVLGKKLVPGKHG